MKKLFLYLLLKGLFLGLLMNWCLARDPFALPNSETGGLNKNISHYQHARLNYLDAMTAAELLKKMSSDAVVTAEKNSNVLLLGINGQTSRILRLLQEIDRPPRTVKLQINILEITANDLSALGIDWSFTSEGFRLGHNPPEIQAVLQAFAGTGKSRLLAAPNLVTLTGKPAVIHIGDRLPYSLPVQSNNTTQWQVQYIDSGINLSFLPLAAAPGEIYLEIKPEISSIKYWKQTPAGEFPVLSTRQVETNLLLKAGESFILAGLYNEEERESVQKVPILGNIPLLNIFFKTTVKEKVASDIIFVVTVEEV